MSLAIRIMFILGRGLSSSLKYLSTISTVLQVGISVVLQTGLRTSISVGAPVALQTGAAGTVSQVSERTSKYVRASLVILQTRFAVAVSEVPLSGISLLATLLIVFSASLTVVEEICETIVAFGRR